MKSNHNSLFIAFLYFAGFILIVALLTWVNNEYVKNNPGGNDFLVHWVGTRAFMEEGISPYSEEVARRIQTMTYGRPARAGEHELRVAYPLYSSYIFAPFALIKDFALARTAWMTLLEISLGLLVIFSLSITKWRPSLWLLTLFFIFGFTWYHSIRPLILGNAVILVSLGIAGAFLAIRSGRDELAGFLLGLTTIKPQVVVLLIGFTILWSISNRRWKLVGWIVGTIVMLSASAAIFIPDWVVQNLREVIRYPSYNPPGNLGAVFATWWPAVGRQIGIAVAVVLLVFLLLEWLASLKRDFRHYLWTACFTLIVSQWIGIQTDPGNFIILFIPLTLVFTVWQERWGLSSHFLILFTMVILSVGVWLLFIETLDLSYQPIQNPVMFLPVPGLLLIGLYWIRWTAIHQKDLWIEMVRKSEGILNSPIK